MEIELNAGGARIILRIILNDGKTGRQCDAQGQHQQPGDADDCGVDNFKAEWAWCHFFLHTMISEAKTSSIDYGSELFKVKVKRLYLLVL